MNANAVIVLITSTISSTRRRFGTIDVAEDAAASRRRRCARPPRARGRSRSCRRRRAGRCSRSSSRRRRAGSSGSTSLDAAEPLALERLPGRRAPSASLSGPSSCSTVEREDADHDRRVDRRQEDRRAEEPPARDAQVDHVGDEQRQRRPGSAPTARTARCCAARAQEDRVVPEHAEVVQADPLRGRDPVPARERVVERCCRTGTPTNVPTSTTAGAA